MTNDDIQATIGKSGKQADLEGADLEGADLYWANLTGANLTEARLVRANLTGANLTEARLVRANLTGANLTEARLVRANLTGATLYWANLTGANLTEANLEGANLTRANLTGARLVRANLYGANLTGATLPHFEVCPEEGSFIAWKKLSGGVLAKIWIPANAERTSSLIGRKCRASHVEVVELISNDSPLKAPGLHDASTIYAVGHTVRADSFDKDIRVECTHGIHFFMTRREAEAW